MVGHACDSSILEAAGPGVQEHSSSPIKLEAPLWQCLRGTLSSCLKKHTFPASESWDCWDLFSPIFSPGRLFYSEICLHLCGSFLHPSRERLQFQTQKDWLKGFKFISLFANRHSITIPVWISWPHLHLNLDFHQFSFGNTEDRAHGWHPVPVTLIEAIFKMIDSR